MSITYLDRQKIRVYSLNIYIYLQDIYFFLLILLVLVQHRE